jgi:hypothetical protein
MEEHNIDFGVPLTREQWDQIGQSANFRPDFGVMRWSPDEPDVIQISIREEELPPGWEAIAPPDDGRRPDDREVARFLYNDGRPFARLEPPDEPKPPAISAEHDRELQVALERWVREKWHELLRLSGIHYDSGSLPAEEPNPPR